MVRPPLFVAVALLLGLAFAFVTPPFEVPDEQNHFWRTLAIGRGHFLTNGGPDSILVVKSTQNFVWVLSRTEPRETLAQKLRIAASLPYDGTPGGTVRFAAWYTPLPYMAQSLLGALPLRPMIVFYGGRVANLLVAVILIALAIREAPEYGGIFAAAALLPMSLYELASLSADATTIALAWLFTAMLLVARRRAWMVALAGFALALCKPAYFLIALLAFVTPFRWRGRIAIIAGTAAGTLLSIAAASRGGYNARVGLPVDAASQIRCIVAHPTQFVGVAMHDVVTNGRFYIEEMVGRFGANEIKLSPLAVGAEIALLIAVAFTAGTALPGRTRMVTIAITALTVFGILLSQYLIWSIVCSDAIEGVQGRYFLEILPLFLVAISLPRLRWHISSWVIVVVAIVCNVVALLTLARHFWQA